MEPQKNTALTSAGAHETASTRFIEANNIRYAYRRFGRASGPPLLLLNYFAATLDDWDPRVTNGLAAEHDVNLFDNTGVDGPNSRDHRSDDEALPRLLPRAQP